MDIAYTHARLGYLLAEAGRYEVAFSHYRQSLGEYEQMEADSSEDQYLRFGAILARAGVGEMQAHLGEHAAAVAESTRAIALLDGIAPDPASGARSSLRGQVYMRVAETYATLGGPAHRRTARDLYEQSLAVWQDMQKRGILTAEDRTKPAELTRALERLEKGPHKERG
jgi:tetratricopeptide (TPR) repeat protein